MKKIFKWIVVCGIGLPIYALVHLLRPFVFFRFGEVYSSRIGHLAGNLDNYVCSRARFPNREMAIFTLREVVANHQLVKMFGRTKKIYFNALLPKLLFPLKRFFPQSPHFISFNEEMWAIKGEAALQPSPVKFTQDEIAFGKEKLRSAGINGEFICFNHRDSAYLIQAGGDGNFHDYRNSRVENYRALVHRALDLGISVVRLGNIVEEEISIDRPGFADFSGTRSSEFMDLFLVDQAKLMIGGNSGFANVGRLFRRPQVIVNFAPFSPAHLWPFSVGTVILPKTLHSRSLGRLLTITEMRALEVSIHYSGNFFADQGIDVLENSPEEIVAAVEEGLALSESRYVDSQKDIELQDKFWNLFATPEEIALFRGKLNFRISSDFLRKHERLLS